MQVIDTAPRQTKYVDAVQETLTALGHATNQELLQVLRARYPEVSATTVHRVTARLWKHGLVGRAPKAADGSERYDTNSLLHHHFMCTVCNRVCDVPATPAAQAVVEQLKALSGECALASTLSMQGICKKCKGLTDE